LVRIPVFGPILAKEWTNVPVPARRQIAQAIVSSGTAGAGYALGAILPEKYHRGALKLVNNFGGQYGMIASMAFIAGAASRKGDSVSQQLKTAATGFIRRDMPLPTTDAIWDVYKAGESLVNGELPNKVPLGLVPPVASSKEFWSVPSVARDPEKWFMSTVPGKKDNFQVTEKEYSLAAPFIKNPKLKAPVKEYTKPERQLREMRLKLKELREKRQAAVPKAE